MREFGIEAQCLSESVHCGGSHLDPALSFLFRKKIFISWVRSNHPWGDPSIHGFQPSILRHTWIWGEADYAVLNKAVMRIHDILGWIRIRSLLFSSLTFKIQQKTNFFNTIFSAYYFLKLHLHHFLKKKSQKESQNSRNQGFSYYFCMTIEGSGSIPLTSGSGSGWPKNCEKHVDPVDPDPQHWNKVYKKIQKTSC